MVPYLLNTAFISRVTPPQHHVRVEWVDGSGKGGHALYTGGDVATLRPVSCLHQGPCCRPHDGSLLPATVVAAVPPELIAAAEEACEAAAMRGTVPSGATRVKGRYLGRYGEMSVSELVGRHHPTAGGDGGCVDDSIQTALREQVKADLTALRAAPPSRVGGSSAPSLAELDELCMLSILDRSAPPRLPPPPPPSAAAASPPPPAASALPAATIAAALAPPADAVVRVAVAGRRAGRVVTAADALEPVPAPPAAAAAAVPPAAAAAATASTADTPAPTPPVGDRLVTMTTFSLLFDGDGNLLLPPPSPSGMFTSLPSTATLLGAPAAAVCAAVDAYRVEESVSLASLALRRDSFWLDAPPPVHGTARATAALIGRGRGIVAAPHALEGELPAARLASLEALLRAAVAARQAILAGTFVPAPLPPLPTALPARYADLRDCTLLLARARDGTVLARIPFVIPVAAWVGSGLGTESSPTGGRVSAAVPWTCDSLGLRGLVEGVATRVGPRAEAGGAEGGGSGGVATDACQQWALQWQLTVTDATGVTVASAPQSSPISLFSYGGGIVTCPAPRIIPHPLRVTCTARVPVAASAPVVVAPPAGASVTGPAPSVTALPRLRPLLPLAPPADASATAAAAGATAPRYEHMDVTATLTSGW